MKGLEYYSWTELWRTVRKDFTGIVHPEVPEVREAHFSRLIDVGMYISAHAIAGLYVCVVFGMMVYDWVLDVLGRVSGFMDVIPVLIILGLFLFWPWMWFVYALIGGSFDQHTRYIDNTPVWNPTFRRWEYPRRASDPFTRNWQVQRKTTAARRSSESTHTPEVWRSPQLPPTEASEEEEDLFTW